MSCCTSEKTRRPGESIKADLVNIAKDKETKVFHVVVVGSYEVGKTSLIQRYIHNKFDEKYNLSIAVDIF